MDSFTGLVSLLFAILQITTTTARCSDDEFTCTITESCIPLSSKCDGHEDCYLGSDEINCPTITCTSSEFLCDDGNCIRSYKKCNGVSDCYDGNDEWGCCASDQVKCDNGDGCVEHYQVCDGHWNCGDGSDESYCPTDAVCGFVCDNGECVTSDERCDGWIDCSDVSDENYCAGDTSSDHSNAIIGPVLAIGVPVVLILAVPLLLVCWYSVRKRRIRAPVVRRVARLPTRHEVILVNCSDRVVAMGTNRLHGNSSLGSGAGFEPPPSYTATPDPAELAAADQSPPPHYSFENPLTTATPTLTIPDGTSTEQPPPPNSDPVAPDNAPPTLPEPLDDGDAPPINEDMQPLLGH